MEASNTYDPIVQVPAPHILCYVYHSRHRLVNTSLIVRSLCLRITTPYSNQSDLKIGIPQRAQRPSVLNWAVPNLK
jgi:hypothetical protein